jgi:predicted acetyltransferase
MAPQSGLHIAIAAADERSVVDNLVQLYIHDFSELFAGTARGDLGNDGRYVVDIPVALWWQDTDRIPLLIRIDGKLAGFALVNAVAHSGETVDRNMAEFFIVRKYRRLGAGTAAAHAIFSRYPGRWEAAVMRANHGARDFWTHSIASHPGAHGMTAADCHDDRWNGTLFRFTIAPD